MRRSLSVLTAALCAALASAGTAGATTFYLSTLGGPVVPALPGSRGGDIVLYDDASPGTATVFFNEDTFIDGMGNPAGPEVDAFELLPNGHMLFSTVGQGTLGLNSVNFLNGDVVEYDPASQLASIIFLESNFTFPNGNQANVDAVAMTSSNILLISTTGDVVLSGLPFSDGDVIEWDPLTDTFVGIYVSEATLFGGLGAADIDAFDVTDDGRWALSTEANASIGGFGFLDGDLVLYDPVGGTTSVWISEGLFSNGINDLDAIAVPEPNALGLLALGLAGLTVVGRRR